MAIEQHLRPLPPPPQQRYPRRQLIHEKRIRRRQLPAPRNGHDQVQLAQDREQDLEAAEERGGEEGVAADADIDGAVAGLVEAVRRVPVGGEDDDGVAEGLEREGGVEDEALGAADAEVRVEEDDAFGAVGRGGGHG
ncbi:MAG: hypothetical protein Q9214_008111, partial [Letrouitia sp. 1 TL-2023]